MLALRSLRARLLIIGIVPVVVALAVTAVLTVRSVDQFADEQREVKRAEQVRDLRQAATALSKLYGDRLREAFLTSAVEGLNRDYLEEAYGGDLYYVEVIDSDAVDAESFGLQPLALGPLPEGVARRLLAGPQARGPAWSGASPSNPSPATSLGPHPQLARGWWPPHGAATSLVA